MSDTSKINRQITVVCGTMICTNFAQTTVGAFAARNGVIYCERCRIDRQRQWDASYHARNKERRNAKKRQAYQPKLREQKVRGRRRRGPGRPPKLTEAQVAEIRERFNGEWGIRVALAREYGVSHTHVSDIVRGKRRA